MRLFVFTALLCIGLSAQALEIDRDGNTILKVLSYNVKCLPFPKKCTKAKMQKIGEILNERRQTNSHPDVVLIQEGFVGDFQKLVQAAGYKYILKGPDVDDKYPNSFTQFAAADFSTQSLKVVGSGLWILTDLPMIHSAKRPFKKNDCTSWDCYSNKGLLLANIQVGEKLISFVTTHMNAGSKAKNEKMRGKQVDDAVRFLKDYYTTKTPLIFAGDFNLKPGRDNFIPLQEKTGTISSGEYCLNNADCEIGSDTSRNMVLNDTVDHHFILPEYLDQLEPVFVERNFSEQIDGKDLSDHLGYEVHYKLK